MKKHTMKVIFKQSSLNNNWTVLVADADYKCTRCGKVISKGDYIGYNHDFYALTDKELPGFHCHCCSEDYKDQWMMRDALDAWKRYTNRLERLKRIKEDYERT